MKFVFAAVAGVCLLAPDAYAADIYVPPAEALTTSTSVYDWTGIYAGVHAGAARGAIGTTGNSVSTSGALVGVIFGALDPATTGHFLGADSSMDISGLIGGVQAGYLLQNDSFVMGLEASFTRANLSHSESYYATALGPLYESTSRLESYATLRAKAGLAVDSVLLYVTSGLAAGVGSADLTITGGVPGGVPGTAYSDTKSRVHTGFTVGAGVGVALDDHWQLSAEYEYVNLGAQPYNFAFANSDGSTATATAGIDLHAVKAWLNYRF